jgi:TonB family protein
LKISSDSLRRTEPAGEERASGPYDPPERAAGEISRAGDVWSLGITLVEILTQRLPVGGMVPRDLPEPFAGIARGCLERNAADRWTIQRISQYLTPLEVPVPVVRRKRYVAPMGVVILLVLLVVIVVGVIVQRSETGAAPPAAASTQTVQTPAPAAEAQRPPEPETKKAATKTQAPPPKSEPAPEPEQPVAASAKPAASGSAPVSGVVAQPMPEITDQAKRSIHGRVRLTVRVDVDPSGTVRDAKVDSPGASKYFTDRALAAARQWKFEPVTVNGSEVGQRWRLRFEFLKTGSSVQPQRVSP